PDPCSRPAGAGQPSAFFLSVTARIHPLLCPLLPSPLCQLVATEISPGKSHILQSIAAASTPLGLLPTSVAVMCLLTHPKEPPYAVPVRQYGPLQSRFLQCRGHPLPPCALLTGFDNSPVRDLHPLDIQRTTLPCGSILGPCWAHTCSCHKPPSSRCQLPLKHDSFVQEQDHERRPAASAGPLAATQQPTTMAFTPLYPRSTARAWRR